MSLWGQRDSAQQFSGFDSTSSVSLNINQPTFQYSPLEDRTIDARDGSLNSLGSGYSICVSCGQFCDAETIARHDFGQQAEHFGSIPTVLEDLESDFGVISTPTDSLSSPSSLVNSSHATRYGSAVSTPNSHDFEAFYQANLSRSIQSVSERCVPFQIPPHSSHTRDASLIDNDVDVDTLQLQTTVSDRSAMRENSNAATSPPRTASIKLRDSNDSEGTTSNGRNRGLSDPVSPPSPEGGQSQPPRHEDDLYTPRWVRGEGAQREGWCSFCRRWLTLKNSAYWYDKTFMHSVSASTGATFYGPCETRPISSEHQSNTESGAASPTRRSKAAAEGKCSSCGEWIPLGNGRKGGRYGQVWFRHASRCQTSTSPRHHPLPDIR